MKKGRTSLRVLRAERDATQALVARLAGLSATRYWQIENGERHPPTPKERAAIASALEIGETSIAWPEPSEARLPQRVSA